MTKNKKITVLCVLFLSLLIINASLIQAKKNKKPKNLKAVYKKFLNEAGPIITPVEKNIFYALKNDKERSEFIDLFWGQRDPTPLTKENEFKQSYYERLRFVNQRFGGEESKPGWATERGKYYLILGKPNTLDRFDGAGKLYPTEVWFYNMSPEHGIPPNFRLVFYRPYGTDFKLYNPNHDGPGALIGAYSGDVNDTYTAFSYLKMWEPQLAPAAISLIPSVRGSNEHTPPMENLTLITNVQALPQRRIDDEYAKKYYKLKYHVKVEVASRFVKSKNLPFISYGRDRQMAYLNLLIQPEKFSIEQYEEKYYTKLDIQFNLWDQETGKKIFSKNRDEYMPMTKSLVNRIMKKKINLTLKYPIVTGRKLKYLLYIKNLASKEYFMDEGEFMVPDASQKPHIVDILIADSHKKATELSVNRPFQVGRTNLFPSVGKLFRKGDKPVLSISINNPGTEDLDAKVYFKGEKAADRELLKTFKAARNSISNFLLDLNTEQMKFGYQTITVELLNNLVRLDSKDYRILYSALKTAPNKPLAVSLKFPDYTLANMYYYFGNQYFLIGEMDRAAYFVNQSLKYKKNINAIYLKTKLMYQTKQHQQGVTYLRGNIKEVEMNNDGLRLLFDGLYQSGDLQAAEKIGDNLSKTDKIDIEFLNQMGFIALKHGKKPKAIHYFSRSLKIDKKQKFIEGKLNELKKK